MKLGTLLPLVLAAVIAMSGATSGRADPEFVSSSGKMSDRDFYHAVACAARPGGKCVLHLRKWPAPKRRNLNVAIAFTSPKFPVAKRNRVVAAIHHAIEQINALGADVHLKFVPDSQADIRFYLTQTRMGGTVRGTGVKAIDGKENFGRRGVAFMRFYWYTESHEIRDAYVLVSKDIRDPDIQSVVLEELVQSLGLSTDLRNPYYRRRSIFAEDGNFVTELAGQDAMALSTHYSR